MAKNKPIDIVAKIVEMLTPFASDERQRIIHAALTLIGDKPVGGAVSQSGHPNSGEDDNINLPHRAQMWMKQNGLTIEELHQVFHITDGNADVIASEIPGKGDKGKTYTAYVLAGIASLLSSGEPHFDDKSARKLCEKFGCYNSANHAAYLKDKGNEITGSKEKEKGWTLTAPGLKRAAVIVKELNKKADG